MEASYRAGEAEPMQQPAMFLGQDDSALVKGWLWWRRW
jgi:hypothetical protein